MPYNERRLRAIAPKGKEEEFVRYFKDLNKGIENLYLELSRVINVNRDDRNDP